MYKKISKVDIVVSVYNEGQCLQKNILFLYDYLKTIDDFLWSIVIADNGSADQTPKIGTDLSLKYERIIYKRIPINEHPRMS